MANMEFQIATGSIGSEMADESDFSLLDACHSFFHICQLTNCIMIAQR